MTDQTPSTEDVRTPVSTYVPTTDEIETAYHEYVSRIEQDSPGWFPEAPKFASWWEAMHGFRRWLAARDRETAAKAWDEGRAAHASDALNATRGYTTSTRNPYRIGAGDE